MKTIKNTRKMLTFADETLNVDKVPKTQYKKLLNNAIAMSYKNISKKTQDESNSQ